MLLNFFRRARPRRWTRNVSDAETVRRARGEFADYLQQDRTSQEAAHDATLVFGELAGNAIRHGGGKAVIDVCRDGLRLIICVTDETPNARLPIPPLNADNEHGRGLRIVKQLTDDVWVRRGAGVKTVCAVLTMTPARSFGASA
ncbi:MAG TPA: ATP-binding protein [Candidatus Baltobacteraceae bacterium]|jgi:anti-sigma regulatory factor (Ser/Thr protein kinase)|nr:ATP-binding protein [Candidatus Baltobacteraceae bacterium]